MDAQDMLAEAVMMIEDAAPHDLAPHVGTIEALLQRLHVRRLATPPLPGPSPPPIMMCDHLGYHLMVGERVVVERGDAGPTIFEIVCFSRADAVLGRAFEVVRNGAKYDQRQTEPLPTLRGTYEVIMTDEVYYFAPDKIIDLITIVHADDITGRQPAPVVKRLAPLYVVEGMRNVYVISHEEVDGTLRALARDSWDTFPKVLLSRRIDSLKYFGERDGRTCQRVALMMESYHDARGATGENCAYIYIAKRRP